MKAARVDAAIWPAVVAVSVAIASLAGGCQGGDRSETLPVTGRVTLDGQPLTSGVVIFTSDSGPSAKSPIGPDGSFHLGTRGDADGAAAGHYRVAIVALDPKAMASADSRSPDQYIPSLVPERYNSTTTSGLEFEVKANELNTANFALSSE